MKSMKMRALSVLLAVCMVMSFGIVSVSADEPAPTPVDEAADFSDKEIAAEGLENTDKTKDPCPNGIYGYGWRMTEGESFILTQDVTITNFLQIHVGDASEVVIDLNGYTLTLNENTYEGIKIFSGDVTIKNGKIATTGNVSGSLGTGSAICVISGYGNPALALENVEIETAGIAVWGFANGASQTVSITMDNVTVSASETAVYFTGTGENNAVISNSTLNGGEGIWNDGATTGSVVVNNTKVTASGLALHTSAYTHNQSQIGTLPIAINGGEWTGAFDVVDAEAIAINSGEFKDESAEAFFAEGSTAAIVEEFTSEIVTEEESAFNTILFLVLKRFMTDYSVTAAEAEGGIVVTDAVDGKARFSTDVTVTPIADEGCELVKLLVNGEEVELTDGAYIINNIKKDTVIVAEFAEAAAE